MSQKELLEAICQHVQIQKDKILQEANDSAAAIVHKAEAELEKIRQGVVEKARSSMRNEQARIVNEARLQSKRELLMAKHQLVQKVMDGLRDRLASLPSKKEYGAVISRLLRESLVGVKGPILVRCRAEDRKSVEDFLSSSKIDAKVETAPFALGGVEVRWGESYQLIRKDTLESRMEKNYPELLKEVNSLIFGDGEV